MVQEVVLVRLGPVIAIYCVYVNEFPQTSFVAIFTTWTNAFQMCSFDNTQLFKLVLCTGISCQRLRFCSFTFSNLL